MIDHAKIIRQLLHEAALRLLQKRVRRYSLEQTKLTLREVLTDRGLYSVRLRDKHDALIAAFLDEHERFERVFDAEWQARKPP